jgi:hypothetical protein
MKGTYGFTTGAKYAEDSDELKVWEQRFTLSPNRWNSAKIAVNLKWLYVPFDEQSLNDVPKTRGLYAFVIAHRQTYFPPHGYIMYVGITGDKAANRSLRIRFKDYLDERDAGGRPKIVNILNKYRDNILFYYAELPDRSQSLKSIEDEMLSALIPPCNEAFSGEIKKAIKACR